MSYSSTPHTPDLSQSSMAVLSDHPESSGPGKPIHQPFLSVDCSNNLLAGSNGLITSHIMVRAVSELPSWLPDPCLDTKEQRDSWSPTHKLFNNVPLWASECLLVVFDEERWPLLSFTGQSWTCVTLYWPIDNTIFMIRMFHLLLLPIASKKISVN